MGASSILDVIMAERRRDVARRRNDVSAGALRQAAQGRTHHSLASVLQERSGQAIVAEVKKASPSAGVLREDYRPDEIAVAYARAGAVGISVLTEPLHFLGSEAHLSAVRGAVDLPILRKDFMCDTYQVLEAAAWGADVILLIAAALTDAEMRDLYNVARELELDVLAEAHTDEEVARALELEDAIIGVNSRNLKTLETDLDTARQAAGRIPHDRASMAESGIRTRDEVVELATLGYDGFLIGESLLKAGSPEAAVKELLVDERVPPPVHQG